MIDSGALQSAENSVRKFVLLPDDDPSIRIIIAAVLALSPSGYLARRAAAERSHWLPHAARGLGAFFEQALADIDDLAKIIVPRAQRNRLAAAVDLVEAILEAGEDEQQLRIDLKRAKLIARLLAFIAGRTTIDQADMRTTIELLFGQIPRGPRETMRYALSRGEQLWRLKECCESTGVTRRIAEPAFRALKKARLLTAKRVIGEGARQHGYRWRANVRARKLWRLIWR